MAEQRQTYRAKNPGPKQPWHKRLLKGIEHGNKFLTYRLFGKLLRSHPRQSPIPLSEVSSVLIVRYDALGDMIVTTPLWRLLKALKPSIKIGVAGSYKNLDLLRTDTDIDVLYDYSAGTIRDFFRLSKETRKTKWDVVIACNFVDRTRNALITRLASPNGITASIGKPGKEGADRLFTRYLVLPESKIHMPMVSQLQYLLRSVIDLPEHSEVHPSIRIDPIAEQITKQRLDAIIKQDNSFQYYVINTDAPVDRKWGVDNNIALAKFISKTIEGTTVFLTSLPENRLEIDTALSTMSTTSIHYFPTADIHEMGTLVRYSTLVITPDTSIAHLASAEMKPVLGFYQAVVDWLPYKVPAYIIASTSGQPISTIPLEIVENALLTFVRDLQKRQQTILRCDAPAEVEVRSFTEEQAVPE